MKITLGKLAGYGYGIPVTILGVALIVSYQYLEGISLFASGFLATPTGRSRLQERFDVEFSTAAAVAIVLLFLVVAMVALLTW